MPKSWWGKAIQRTYVAGYFLYLISSAIWAWPLMTFFEWRNYVAFQMFYGLFWPVLLPLQIQT